MRAHVFHRRIGAVADHRARFHQLLPDVSALFGALRPQAQQHVRRIRGAVDALHRGDHAQFAEARDIGGARGAARARSASADPSFRDARGKRSRRSSSTSRLARSPMACTQSWISCAMASSAVLRISAGSSVFEAAAFGDRRLVGIRLQQPGAARAQRAIHLPLDGAHGEVIVAGADDAVLVETSARVARWAPRSITQSRSRVRASAAMLFNAIDGGEGRAGIFEGRDAFRQAFASGQVDVLARASGCPFGSGLLRLPVAYALGRRALRALAQQAGGIALRVLEDARRQRGSACRA